MGFYIIWIILAFLVGLVGKERKIGFGQALLWAILLSPLIGLIIALVSDKKSSNKNQHKYRAHKELGEKAEYKSQFKEAVDHYMDSLYHLETDYKNKRISSQMEDKRQNYIYELREKIKKIKKNNPDLF